MLDPQLLRLREEYRRVVRRKLEIEAAIRLMEDYFLLAGKCIASLQRDERPSESILEAVNLKAKSNLTLLYKALGLRKQTELSLIEKKAELQNIGSKLASLTTCPRCSGLGSTPKPTRYERMQEGGIIPVSSTSKCDLCNGSGKLVLNSE